MLPSHRGPQLQPRGSRTFSVVLAVCFVFVTASFFVSTFRVVAVQSAFSVRLEQVAAPASSFTERVLARLEERERKEIDPWMRDDIRIAWITVSLASRGEGDSHFWATYNVLGCHPDQVWPKILARRKAALGGHYEEFWGVVSAEDFPPKKPAQSVKVEMNRRAAAA